MHNVDCHSHSDNHRLLLKYLMAHYTAKSIGIDHDFVFIEVPIFFPAQQDSRGRRESTQDYTTLAYSCVLLGKTPSGVEIGCP